MAHLAQHGITCPQPVTMRNGDALGTLAGRPRRSSVFSKACGCEPERRPLRRGRSGPGEAASCGPRFSHDAPHALSVSGWRPLYELAASRADTLQHGLRACSAMNSTIWKILAEAFAARRDSRHLFPDNVFSGRQAVRADRFLFRLQRYPRLRRRDLPQRLVFRERSFLQRGQGARVSRPYGRERKLSTPSSRRCRCWRGEPRSASC